MVQFLSEPTHQVTGDAVEGSLTTKTIKYAVTTTYIQENLLLLVAVVTKFTNQADSTARILYLVELRPSKATTVKTNHTIPITKFAVKILFILRGTAILAFAVEVLFTIDKETFAAEENWHVFLKGCHNAAVISQSTSLNKSVMSLLVTSRVAPVLT